jgi:hypothetical protein
MLISLSMRREVLEEFLGQYGTIEEQQSLIFTPTVRQDLLRLQEKIQQLSQAVGEPVELPSPEPETPKTVPVYNLILPRRVDVVKTTRSIAQEYLRKNVEEAQSASPVAVGHPTEQVVVVLEHPKQKLGEIRHRKDPIYHATKQIVGPTDLADPTLVGIDPEKARLILVVKDTSTGMLPLPTVLPSRLPHSTVVNVRRSQAPSQPPKNPGIK